jgi:hypothetical protein
VFHRKRVGAGWTASAQCVYGCIVTSPRRAPVSQATLRRLFEEFAGMCAIADCPYPDKLPDGTPTLQIAYITSATPGGVRHDPSVPLDAANESSNLLLLCPTHHQAIDALPQEYPADRLRLIRQWHVDRVAAILNSSAATAPPPPITNRLQSALELWRNERQNPSEEFWHAVFLSRPELLAPTVNGRAFTLNSKCYVGGKAIDNSGGNVLDFLAQHSGDAALIEIKPPTAPLVGPAYRTNVVMPSRELVGAITQVLIYRASLLADLHALRGKSPTSRSSTARRVRRCDDRSPGRIQTWVVDSFRCASCCSQVEVT